MYRCAFELYLYCRAIYLYKSVELGVGGFIYLLFIMALQHKCWRSVGHQVLQPAKDGKLGWA